MNWHREAFRAENQAKRMKEETETSQHSKDETEGKQTDRASATGSCHFDTPSWQNTQGKMDEARLHGSRPGSRARDVGRVVPLWHRLVTELRGKLGTTWVTTSWRGSWHTQVSRRLEFSVLHIWAEFYIIFLDALLLFSRFIINTF